MTGAKLLALLRETGVKLWVEEEVLRYRAPMGALTESLRAEMATHKAEILQLLRENKRFAHPNLPPLVRIPRSGEQLPLSFAQQRLWFINQLDPDSPAYNISWAVRAQGPLNVTALERTFNEIVRRHEIFRTTCSTVNGEPLQVLSPVPIIPLPVVDLRQIGEVETEATVRRLATEEASQPFDFVRGPFLRARLLQLDGDDHVLLLTTHHFVIDGWSFGIFFQEISTLYEAFSTGKSSPLPDLVIQYADFAQWQRQCLQGDILDSQIAYWKKQLAGAPELFELPTDRSRPPIQSNRGAFETVVLSRNLSEALKRLSRKESVTLFMTLLTAFQTLLYRYTAQSDVIVGTGVSNRNRKEIEGLIGAFANNLLLRTDVSGNPTFRSLLRRVSEVAIGAYAHQDVPFQKLVEELQPKRNLAHHPLFQVMFIHHPEGAERILRLKDLSLSWVPLETGITEYDLLLLIVDGPVLAGGFNYNTDLFEASSIQRMRGHFQTLLEGIVTNPERHISDLPLLTEAERNQLLIEWNDTERDYPSTNSLQQLIETQVERTPDAVALVFEDKQLTYRELNSRANQLAHYLRKLGIGPDSLVGIGVERSLEMVVGLLGILKTGGAYVPLDPAFPKERLAFMLEDAQVKAIVTQPGLRSDLPEHGARTIRLDSDWGAIGRENTENLACDATPQNRAYVIYTSGSTGKPKGVEVMHSSVVNFLTSIREKLAMTERDVMLAVTTISFDIAGLELYLPLVVGGRVVIASREIAMDGSWLSQHISDSQATVMQATPATWRILIDAGWQGSKQLKILCGGEALPRELANQLIERSASLWNMYGPTETTIWSTVHQICSTEGPVLVGRPIANTRIYILDRYMQPTPIGVPGELCIGGAGSGARLSQPSRADRGEIHCRSFQPGARRADLPDRRLGALFSRW